MTLVYSSNNKQYVFKQTSGKVWNFYQDDKLGLCHSTLTKRNTWSEPVSIQKSFYQKFYVDMDYEDRFHILFQDKQGNIFYTLIDENNMNTMPILNSKSPSLYDKYLYLIPNRKAVHIFFIIEYNNSTILAHQILTDKTVNTPKVIDYIVKTEHPFSAVCDKSDNIYMFYQVSDGKYIQLGFKKYSVSQKSWGEFTPITRFDGDCEFPRTIIDNKDIIHISYQRHTGKQYELVYQQKIPDRNLWTSEVVIHGSQYAFKDSSVVFMNNNIIVYWVRDDIIYYSFSSDNDVSWSRPTRYNFVTGRQLVNIGYKSNDPVESEKNVLKDIPGNFVNGFKLAFFHDPSNTNNISPDELKSILLEGFKSLKGNVEELQESNISLKESILSTNLAQQNLNKELTKYSVKLSLLENEFNQLRSVNQRLENLNITVDEFEFAVKSKIAELDRLKSNLLSKAYRMKNISESNDPEQDKPVEFEETEAKELKVKKILETKEFKSKR